MKILFRNALLSTGQRRHVLVSDDRIERIASPDVQLTADRVIDCENRLLIPGLYNTHSHVPMTILRGYGEDMPLQTWLYDRIFPAEAQLTEHDVYIGALLGIAEMLSHGIVSFTDMYMKVDQTVRAVLESGIKANLSNGLVAFDPSADPKSVSDYLDCIRLVDTYHGEGEGRVKIDASVHAEYTSFPGAIRTMAEYSAERGLCMQIHLSETEKEHEECIARRAMTPAAYMNGLGVFDSRTTAAHCVYVTKEDCAILREKNVTVAHNPVSNLKLGSGVMNYTMLREEGVRVALGTDGAASNNALDIFREMHLASILHKGIARTPESFCAEEFFTMATKAGAWAQGREDGGEIAEGNKADIVLVNTDSLCMTPIYHPITALTYAASGADVALTMVDGKILYENGVFTTIDIEKVRSEMKHVCAKYL